MDRCWRLLFHLVVMDASLFAANSVNQMSWSGPLTIECAPLSAVGIENSLVTRPRVWGEGTAYAVIVPLICGRTRVTCGIVAEKRGMTRVTCANGCDETACGGTASADNKSANHPADHVRRRWDIFQRENADMKRL